MALQDSRIDGVVTGINVTPLVDIMLVLLIIFMVTAKFMSDSEIKIVLPKAITSETSSNPALNVSLDSKGQIRLMENEVNMNELKTNLIRESQINRGVRVTLAADGSLPYAQIMTVLDLIKQSGVTRVALAAER